MQFFYPDANHVSGASAISAYNYDRVDGQYLGDRQPWKGTAADIFAQAQFPLHSGRIPISVMELVVAMLSVTGVYIWWKKRAARIKQSARALTCLLINKKDFAQSGV